MTNRWKHLAGICAVVLCLMAACNERGNEKDMNEVNKSDTRRNTTGTENTLESDSAHPTPDSAQHGGPDEPPH